MSKKENVGKLIRDIREDLHLSQEDVAKEMNVSVEQIKKWEDNSQVMSQKDMQRLSVVFSKTPTPKPTSFLEYLKNQWKRIGYYFLFIGIIGFVSLVWSYFKNNLTSITTPVLVFGSIFMVFIIAGGILIFLHRRQIKTLKSEKQD